MAGYFHVTSSKNRDSIWRHGLDWTRMGASCGIAGSPTPEQDGIFLCRGEPETRFFISGNNTGGPVDVWEVDGVDAAELVESPEGFSLVPRQIPPSQLRMIREGIVDPCDFGVGR